MIRELLKRWLGVQHDIDNAIAQTRAEEEKKHTEQIAAMQQKLCQFNELQARMQQFHDLAKGIVKHDGPGRPKLDRQPFELKIDSGLKDRIKLLEKAGVLKRGAVTAHINEDLWGWLDPLYEKFNTAFQSPQ